METVVIPVVASFTAGVIDSIVGGGGLILLPALFSTFPNAAPATLFGTNKVASVSGTSIAAVQYSRRVKVNWRSIVPAALFALAGAFLGAWSVSRIDPGLFRKILPFILLFVFVYTLLKKEFGKHRTFEVSAGREVLLACGIGLVIGFYDGFFGPGTGSFFIFLLIRFLGYDFLQASASAKILNTATNLSALALFSISGVIWWHLGLVMAVANIGGSLVGTRLAMKHGTQFVRMVFILVVGALIVKSFYSSYLG